MLTTSIFQPTGCTDVTSYVVRSAITATAELLVHNAAIISSARLCLQDNVSYQQITLNITSIGIDSSVAQHHHDHHERAPGWGVAVSTSCLDRSLSWASCSAACIYAKVCVYLSFPFVLIKLRQC